MNEIEVSVVMPCLNEAATVGICVEKALRTLKELGYRGEVIVADNGSTDGSVAIAQKAGAKVVHQSLKGYGNAYKKGFQEAQGKYLVMGDADDSYDFTDLKRFVEPLKQGYDMVMGTRLKGYIKEGAMPFLHRYLGVPALTWMLNLLYGAGISDAHCGMRSFTKEAYEKMHLETTGMELASEIVIKATYANLKIFEIPITLHPDGRPGKPHLKSFSDGWRHARFMLNYKPSVLYSIPGWILLVLGIISISISAKWRLGAEYISLKGLFFALFGVLFALSGVVLLKLRLLAEAKNYIGAFPKTEKNIEIFYRKFHSSKSIGYGILYIFIGLIILLLRSKLDLILGLNFGLLIISIGIIEIFFAFLLGQMNIYGKE
jgi:glycosyltransferase involved in cell wall biosynthesis